MFKRSSKNNAPAVPEQAAGAGAQSGMNVAEIVKQTVSEQADIAEKAVAESAAAAEQAVRENTEAAEQAVEENVKAAEQSIEDSAEAAEQSTEENVAETEQATGENTEAAEQAIETSLAAEEQAAVETIAGTPEETQIVPAEQNSAVSTSAIEIKADKNRKKREKKAKRNSKRTLGVKKGLSNIQKAVLIAASILLVFALAGVIMYFASGASKSVYVVSAQSVLQENMFYYGEGNGSGIVKAENVQAQYVSDTLKVNEIYVKEGDRVKVGDLVMSYDTTLDSLEVDKYALEVSQKELELVNLKKQLSEINSMKPSDPNAQPSAPTEKPETPTGEIVLTYKRLEGSGTGDDPYIYILAGSSIPCDDDFLSSVFNGGDSAWVVFENRTANMTGGRVNNAWGVHFSSNSSGDTSFDFFDASDYIYVPEGEWEEVDYGSGYTAEQIAQMRADTQKEITDTDLEVRIMKVKLAQKRLELSGGDVYSKVDGVVKEVRSESEARENNEPVLFISGGGGFVIESPISELMLESVNPGDRAVINSYETGMTYDGEIISVLDLPITRDSELLYYYYSDGAAASYYPVKIFVDESSGLRENEIVSVNYDTSVVDAKYLESVFVLKENGSSYIYVEGENGLLEKRRISTGGTLWGYMTQVTGGMTGDEFIAFPYGTNVREGAKVQECSLDEFYNHLYGY